MKSGNEYETMRRFVSSNEPDIVNGLKLDEISKELHFFGNLRNELGCEIGMDKTFPEIYSDLESHGILEVKLAHFAQTVEDLLDYINKGLLPKIAEQEKTIAAQYTELSALKHEAKN